MKDEILQSVKEILMNDNQVYEEDFKPEANLQNDLGLDSLDVVELVMKLEEKYHIHIPDSAEDIDTVQDAVNLVEKIINEK